MGRVPGLGVGHGPPGGAAARDVVQHEWYVVPLGYPFDDLRIAVETATGTPVQVVQRPETTA